MPAADRVKYHIDKKGQNFIDKEALTKWMEEAAVASQIGQDYIPYTKESKGEDSFSLRSNSNSSFMEYAIVLIYLKLSKRAIPLGRVDFRFTVRHEPKA